MRQHYLFKITNKINGKYYYAKHSTDDINDGYMGSGTYIKNAIAKYGIESFDKEVRMLFRCEALAYEWEEYLSHDEDWPNDNKCYNQVFGGDGFDSRSAREMSKKAVVFCKDNNKWIYDNKFHAAIKEKNVGFYNSQTQQNLALKAHESMKTQEIGIYDPNNDWGQQINASQRMHIPENELKRINTIKKNKSLSGAKNAMWGKSWYTNGTDNILLRYTDSIPVGFKLGRHLKINVSNRIRNINGTFLRKEIK